MSTEGIIAAVVMLIVGAVWLALPILRRKYFVSSEELARQKEREILVNAYERTLASLRDVDEDHLTGKLADADYDVERTYWTDQGVTILQALDETGGKPESKRRKPAKHQPAMTTDAEVPDGVTAGATADAMLDDAIERTIAQYIKSTH